MLAALIPGYQRPLDLLTLADPELASHSSHRSSVADQQSAAKPPATASGRGNGR